MVVLGGSCRTHAILSWSCHSKGFVVSQSCATSARVIIIGNLLMLALIWGVLVLVLVGAAVICLQQLLHSISRLFFMASSSLLFLLDQLGQIIIIMGTFHVLASILTQLIMDQLATGIGRVATNLLLLAYDVLI